MGFEFLKEQPETVAELPASTQERLANIQRELENSTDPFAEVALRRLKNSIKREDLLSNINSIQSSPEFPQLTESLRTELSALEQDIETTGEQVGRVASEVAGDAKDTIDELHPAAQAIVYTTGAATGMWGISKVWRWLSRKWDRASDAIVHTGEKGVGVLKKVGSGIKFVLMTALAAVGITSLWQKFGPGAKEQVAQQPQTPEGATQPPVQPATTQRNPQQTPAPAPTQAV